MAIFYFRNDDVNVLEEPLIQVTRRCTAAGVPITHAVEPANVTDETVAWLLAEKTQHPRLIEVMQHGYDHVERDKGEFGGRRPYAEQLADLAKGRNLLEAKFGAALLPSLNFPFGPYNGHSMRAADQVGYRIVCSHYNYRLSRRMMYAVGHFLRRGQFLGHHVSYHLDFYPGTDLFSIDMAVSFIARYLGPHGSHDCIFHNPDTLLSSIKSFMRHTPVVGILLHHRFHHQESSLDLITDLVENLRSIPGSEFWNLREIYQRFCPDPGEGFRDGN